MPRCPYCGEPCRAFSGTCAACDDLPTRDPSFPSVDAAPLYGGLSSDLLGESPFHAPELPPQSLRPGSRLDRLRQRRYSPEP